MSPVVASASRLKSLPLIRDTPEGLPCIEQVFYRNRINEKQAENALREWWESDSCISSDIGITARITRCIPEYIPFWKISAVAEGCLKGIHDDGLEVSMLESVEYSFRQRLTWSCQAADVPDLGVGFLRNYSGISDQSGKGPSPQPERMLPEGEACHKAQEAMEKYIRKSAAMNQGIRSEDLRFSEKKDELVFYPFWRVYSAYEGKEYPATVDGITGTLVAGQAPGDRATWWTTALVVTGFALGVPVLLLTHQWGIAYIPAIIGTTILHWPITKGFAFVRFGSVIATGELPGYKPSVLNESLNGLLGLFYLVGCFGILFTLIFVIRESELAARIAFMICFLFYLVAAVFTFDNSWTYEEAVTADSISAGFFAERKSPAQ